MQMIENLSRIDGPITHRQPSTEQPEWDDVTVRLEHADKVDDRAELLQAQLGAEVVISAPRELLGDAKVGDTVDGHVSIVGPGRVFASPQSVDGGRFDVLPSSSSSDG